MSRYTNDYLLYECLDYYLLPETQVAGSNSVKMDTQSWVKVNTSNCALTCKLKYYTSGKRFSSNK